MIVRSKRREGIRVLATEYLESKSLLIAPEALAGMWLVCALETALHWLRCQQALSCQLPAVPAAESEACVQGGHWVLGLGGVPTMVARPSAEAEEVRPLWHPSLSFAEQPSLGLAWLVSRWSHSEGVLLLVLVPRSPAKTGTQDQESQVKGGLQVERWSILQTQQPIC